MNPWCLLRIQTMNLLYCKTFIENCIKYQSQCYQALITKEHQTGYKVIKTIYNVTKHQVLCNISQAYIEVSMDDAD